MKNYYRTARNRILNFFKGRLGLQPIFQRLHLFILGAMGIGTGGETETSGEKIVLKHVRKFLAQSDLTIFDVGANIGNYTKILRETFPKALIYSFEPSQKTFAILRERFPSEPHTVNIGFSDKSGKISLYTNKNNSTISSIYKRKWVKKKHRLDTVEIVEMGTIDKFSSQNNIERIDFLKLDTEGHELKCLEGAQNMISADAIRFIQFEFGGCNVDSRTFFRDFFNMLKNKYKIYRIMQHGLFPISEYDERQEIFLTTNYLAELKPQN